MRGVPLWVLDDEMLTMRPHPASSMCGRTAWQQWNVPTRLTSKIWPQCSGVISRKGTKLARPALLTRMVGAPRPLGDLVHRLEHPLRSVTSTSRPIARPLHRRCPRRLPRRQRHRGRRCATAAPSRASRWLMPRPMPEAPPVTTATARFAPVTHVCLPSVGAPAHPVHHDGAGQPVIEGRGVAAAPHDLGRRRGSPRQIAAWPRAAGCRLARHRTPRVRPLACADNNPVARLLEHAARSHDDQRQRQVHRRHRAAVHDHGHSPIGPHRRT